MLLSTSLLTLLATSSLASPHLQNRQQQTYPCTSGIFILAARGTDQTGACNDPTKVCPNFADLQGLQDVAQAAVNKAGQNSYYRALPYAASPGATYFESIRRGIEIAQGIVTEYVDRCSGYGGARMVLLGYSQGAQVMTSVLIGGSALEGARPGLSAGYTKRVIAGAFFASPSFVANYPIDGGNATTSGTFRRTDLEYKPFSDTYSARIKSYCQAGDRFCATGLGNDALTIHVAAIGTYKQEATNFVVARV